MNTAVAPESLAPAQDVRLMQAASALLLAGALCALLWGVVGRLLHTQALRIQVVVLTGQTAHVNAAALRTQLQDVLKGAFFDVQPQAVKQALERMPWVESAVVRRVFPDQLNIALTEHSAVALWGKQADGYRLIDAQGEIFDANIDEAAQETLPELDGADAQGAEVLAMYHRLNALFAPLHTRLERLHCTPRGVWLATLEEGTELNLGAGDAQELSARVRAFVYSIGAVSARYARTPADVLYADLRYRSGYAMRLKGVETLPSGAEQQATRAAAAAQM